MSFVRSLLQYIVLHLSENLGPQYIVLIALLLMWDLIWIGGKGYFSLDIKKGVGSDMFQNIANIKII